MVIATSCSTLPYQSISPRIVVPCLAITCLVSFRTRAACLIAHSLEQAVSLIFAAARHVWSLGSHGLLQ